MKGIPSVDLPFHGKSQLRYENLQSLVRDMALRIPRDSILIGWSLGASLSLLMAYMFPEKFRGLVLIGGSACFGCLWDKKNLRGFLIRLEREGEKFLKEFRSLSYPKAFEDHIDLQGAKTLLKDYMELDIRHILPHIKQRVIILHGTQDPITPLSSALTLYNMLKGAKLITFLGGHFPEDESLIFEVLKSL
ncbi:alpha/beta hydrolase [Hydrogenobacter sp. T-2]|uniref:alpha/beta fold hydrolase n=1 Tax=Pampinifervens diazotrophicum TaxID=1632018 RepID=UPI002B26084E|nr:alpha/beta hydrolase [Hydrogenobacter sp. T-2]WPM32000.1 alpha/beta hydrolase [Hydrogenobacter sp. T-2]